MVLAKLLAYIFGYVSMVVKGDFLEKFVNMATSRGIYLWDITRLGPDKMRVKVKVSDIRPLRHIARATKCRFKIVERMGLPFVLNRLKKRKILALGGLAFIIILYILSSFVWFIDVTGTDKLSKAEIIEIARESGLRPGAAKWQVDTKQVEKSIRERLNAVAWVGVTIEGTRVTIEIAERKLVTEEINRGPAHLVAGKAGLIKEVLVLKGQAMVKEGETVLPGQLLISGEVKEEVKPELTNQPLAEGQEPPEPKFISHFVQAKGIVRARVWYEGYGECQITETMENLSGRHKNSIRIKIGAKEIIISGPKDSPYQYFELKQEVKRLPGWRNIEIPVELVSLRFNEKIISRVNRGETGARKIAEEIAMNQAKAKVPQGAKIVEQRVEQVSAGKAENLIRIKAFVETVEDIGQIKPFKATEEVKY